MYTNISWLGTLEALNNIGGFLERGIFDFLFHDSLHPPPPLSLPPPPSFPLPPSIQSSLWSSPVQAVYVQSDAHPQV